MLATGVQMPQKSTTWTHTLDATVCKAHVCHYSSMLLSAGITSLSWQKYANTGFRYALAVPMWKSEGVLLCWDLPGPESDQATSEQDPILDSPHHITLLQGRGSQMFSVPTTSCTLFEVPLIFSGPIRKSWTISFCRLNSCAG